MKSKVSARPEALDSLLDQLPKAPFGRSDVTVGYLRLIRSTFADQTDQEGLPHTLAELDLEFVVPREQSINTAVVCRCCLAKPVYWLGLKSAHCRCRRSTKAMRRSWLLPLGAWGATSRRWLGQKNSWRPSWAAVASHHSAPPTSQRRHNAGARPSLCGRNRGRRGGSTLCLRAA